MTLKQTLLFFVFILLINPTLQSQKIYLSQQIPPVIYRMNIDGSNLEEFQAPVAEGFAVDKSNSVIYSASSNSIVKVDFGDISSFETVITGVGNALSINLDDINQKLYWINNLNNERGIYRCNTDGTELELLYEFPFAFPIRDKDIDLDIPNGKIYVSNAEGSEQIIRLNLDGTNKEVILIRELNHDFYSINLNLSEQTIYTGTYKDNPNYNETNSVRKLDFDGTGEEEIFGFDDTAFSSVYDTEIDTINNKIYIINHLERKVQQMNFDGSNFETIVEFEPSGLNTYDFDRILVVYDGTTDVEILNEKNQGIKFFPNPSNGVFSIQKNDNFRDNSLEQIVISNQLGIQLYHYSESVNQLVNIDISHLNNGIYFLTLLFEDGVKQSQKIILNK